MNRSVLAALALLVAAPVRPAQAQNLEPLVDRLTQAWNRADAGAIASFASREGVSIEIGGMRVGSLPARQVGAALRRLFDCCETLAARSASPKIVGGSPKRAFVEITWTTRARGTTVPERSTVFLGLSLEGDRWRVTEIRHIK